MARRIGLGALLVGALVGMFLLDSRVLPRPLLSRLVLWIFALGAIGEVLTMAGRKIERAPGLFAFAGVAVVAVVVPSLVAGTAVPPVLLLLAALVGGGIRLIGMAPQRSAALAFPEAAALALAIVYVALPIAFLDRILVESVASAYVVFLVAKATDFFGYFIGTAVGRRRIVPAISPKKTWEGTIGGLLASAGAAALLYDHLPGTRTFAAAIGLILGASTFLGDLVESGLKRWAGVKDSAALLPEFGGFLDMIDGILVAAPVAVVCLYGS